MPNCMAIFFYILVWWTPKPPRIDQNLSMYLLSYIKLDNLKIWRKKWKKYVFYFYIIGSRCKLGMKSSHFYPIQLLLENEIELIF